MSNTAGNFTQFPGPLGPKCDAPANVHFDTRNPTIYDPTTSVADWWFNTVTWDLFYCASFVADPPTQQQEFQWIQIGSALGDLFTLTSQSGAVIQPIAGTIFVVGDNTNIDTTGDMNTHQIIINLKPNISVTTVTTTGDVDCGANVNAADNVTAGISILSGGTIVAQDAISSVNGGLTIGGGSVVLPLGTGLVQSTAGALNTIPNGADGEVLTMVLGNPAWAPIPGAGGGTTSFAVDSGANALPDGGGQLTVTGISAGYGQMLQTVSSANTVEIAPNFPLAGASDGMVYVAGSSGGAWAHILGINGITVAEGDGTLTLDGSGIAPGTGMVLAHTDGADALIAAVDNSFTFSGDGTLIETDGNTPFSKITIRQVTNPIISGNLRFSSYGAGVLVSSATGVITSLQGATAFPPGANRFLMSRPAGTAPIFGTIAAEDPSIVITPSATGITIKATGAGGGGISDAALYTMNANRVVNQVTNYVFGSATPMVQVFDRAVGPQFIGTTFTANKTGIWSFYMNIPIIWGGGEIHFNISIVVTDGITPENSRQFNSFVTTNSSSANAQQNIHMSANALMNATSTVRFLLANMGTSAAPITIGSNSLNLTYPYIEWYYVSA